MATVNEKMTAIADEIRTLSGTTGAMGLDAMASNVGEANGKVTTQVDLIEQIQTALEGKATGAGKELPELTNPGSAADLLAGKQLIDGNGNIVEGTIATKTSSNLTASGAIVTVPAGYYASNTTKSVSTATQASPSITVSSSGLITASVTQSAGYVKAGTRSGAKQLTTKSATTITPTTSEQTAVNSGVYTTGAIKVAAIPSNYEDVTDETSAYTSLNSELESVINSLEDGEGGGTNIDTCTVIVNCTDYTNWTYTYTAYENSTIVSKINDDWYNGVGTNTLTFTNVVCGSVFTVINSGSSQGQSTIDNDTAFFLGFRYGDVFFSAPTVANTTVTVTLRPYD
jgi:hypothetical protein